MKTKKKPRVLFDKPGWIAVNKDGDPILENFSVGKQLPRVSRVKSALADYEAHGRPFKARRCRIVITEAQ